MRISIPKPCHANWNNMTKEERSRFCSLCQKSVHNVADLTEQEAQTVLSEDDICARISYNDEGHIQTRNGFSSMLLITGLLACNDGQVEAPPTTNHETTEQIDNIGNTEKTKASEDHISVGKTIVQNTDQNMQNHDKKQTSDEDCAIENAHTSQGTTDNPKPKPPKMGRIAKPKDKAIPKKQQ